jgi:hypothetical protein
MLSARLDLPTEVHVKLLGWIKSAVEFVKIPAGPHKIGPQPDAPHEIDSRTAPRDISPEHRADIESRPEGEISVAPESLAGAAPESRISVEFESPVGQSDSAPNQEEIDRRRSLVRGFFNDYWSSIDDKPTSFADRLDGAEGYINERVAAGGETWQLSPATRKQLGLPPSRKK